MLRSAAYRLYQDFLMPSRLDGYERLLSSFRKAEYTFLTICDLAVATLASKDLPRLTCVIRSDVDTDSATAQRMFEIEQSVGARTTYYFRLSTLDVGLTRRLGACGSEAGYHYEELATIARRLGLRNKADVDANLPLIRESFARNIEHFARTVGFMPRTIASHGDFINRKLKIPNYYAIDGALRERFSILAEAYDTWLNTSVGARFSDCDAPAWWMPEPPDKAISGSRRLSKNRGMRLGPPGCGPRRCCGWWTTTCGVVCAFCICRRRQPKEKPAPNEGQGRRAA